MKPIIREGPAEHNLVWSSEIRASAISGVTVFRISSSMILDVTVKGLGFPPFDSQDY